MAVNRFEKQLGVEFRRTNSSGIDLFDQIHASKVLDGVRSGVRSASGGAEGPRRRSLSQAVEGLAQDGKVVSVRLALFAEMVKGKPWTPATLKEVGGTEGVGVTFLEETFGSPDANPKHRLHQKAAQAVLKALLPEPGPASRAMKSDAELMEASGYAQRPGDFDDLIRILDAELRLITPTDPEGSSGEDQRNTANPDEQLLPTHPRLSRPLAPGMADPQAAGDPARSGRTEAWPSGRRRGTPGPRTANCRPSSSGRTSVSLTRRKDWTEPQRRMMRRAGRFHGMRALGLAVLIGLGTWGGIEGYGNLRAAGLVEKLETASTTEVPPIIEQLTAYRRWAARPLERLLASTEDQSGPHLRASLASLALWPGDGKQAEYLEDRLLASSPVELPVIWGILRKHEQGTDKRLRQLLEDPKADPERRFRAACALANSDDAQVEKRWDAVAPFLADRFLAAVIKNPGDYSPLIETLRPIRQRLLPPLASIFRDTGRSESERNFATTLSPTTPVTTRTSWRTC